MGRKVTIEKAAKYASRSARTVRYWLEQNKLTRYTMGKLTQVDLDEVDVILDEKTRPAPTPQLLAVVMRRLENLERKTEFLMYMSGQHVTHEITSEQAVATYYVAQDQCKRVKFLSDEVKQFTALLCGISEQILEMIEMDTGDPHPWIPFHRLCTKLIKYLKDKKGFNTSLESQQLYQKLFKAKEYLHGLALIFIEMDTNSDTRKILTEALGPYETLESELAKAIVWRKQTEGGKRVEPLPDDPVLLLREAAELLEDNERTAKIKARVFRRLERAESLLKSGPIDLAKI
jgi:hypothetical protein